MRLSLILLHLFTISLFSAESIVPIYMNSQFGQLAIKVRLKSNEEIKSKNVIKQKLDFSCGSAATATLFNYYLNDPLSEEEVIKGLFHFGNKKKIIKNRGFSLLDIKKLGNALGYVVKGYRTNLKGLLELNMPSIVTIVLGDYKHFVIFKGYKKNRVFLADPALGNTIVTRKKFLDMWYKNIALVIKPKRRIKKNKLALKRDDLLLLEPNYFRNILFDKNVLSFKTNYDY